jgi:hypothetical protein
LIFLHVGIEPAVPDLIERGVLIRRRAGHDHDNPIALLQKPKAYRMTEVLLISTLREAGRIIGEYIEPGPRDAEQTLSRLIAVLETQDLARAIERLQKGHGLRVVK